MKIWAKVMVGDKIKKDVIYESELSLTPSNFQKMLQEIAYLVDVATPISLPSHFKHFEKFNRVKYIPRDFIEECDFTSFVLERVIENKKPKHYYI